MPPRLYCGNNANHPDVVNGTAVIGNRRGCLEKGKFIGYQQAADATFLREYVPIDDTRKYCGNHEVMPAGYDRFGGLYECFLKGMGVGKRQKAVDVLGPGGPAPGGGGGFGAGGGFGPGGGFGAGGGLPIAPMIVYVLLILFFYWQPPVFLMVVDEKGQPVRRSTVRYFLFAIFVFLVVMIPYCFHGNT